MSRIGPIGPIGAAEPNDGEKSNLSDLPDRIAITPVDHPVKGSIRPPGSKSITNRALVCAALATGSSALRGALDSEDTQVMVDSLHRLGVRVDLDLQTQQILATGTSGEIPIQDADLFVGNSGTTIRFLTAMLATCKGRFRLDGVERMRQRPIGDLLDAVRQLGGRADCEMKSNCPPLVVTAGGLPGGTATIRGDISSQFLSGLLMACPYAQSDVDLVVDGELVSQPYVTMTLGVMSSFGVDVDVHSMQRFHIAAGQRYRGCVYDIEPDASAASYFWAAAAITGGRVLVHGLTRNALQGDVAFCDCLARMGCTVEFGFDGITVTGGPLQGIEVDMNSISDTVQTLAAVALFADGPTTITGVAHIRHKESDRLGDLARELRRLGAEVDERSDGLRIIPLPLHGAEIETYRDHRMAMSLALVGLRIPDVVIKDPGCTDKTYPDYFRDLAKLTAS
jgi:3-phosphoshikimate 1-carboxyvinyltransferase